MSSLEHRLAGRFELRTFEFEHAGVHLELIGPSSPDELIDDSAFNIDERLPYWAELWPSARALAIELLERPLPPGPVLELGCGLALPSLALLSRGVRVVASDYYGEALEFAVANALRNDLPPPDTLLLDWRSPADDFQRYPTIVAADVLYERRNAETLSRLLSSLPATATVLLADPGRAYLPLFRTLFEAEGGQFREAGVRRVPGAAPGRHATIHLLELTPPG